MNRQNPQKSLTVGKSCNEDSPVDQDINVVHGGQGTWFQRNGVEFGDALPGLLRQCEDLQPHSLELVRARLDQLLGRHLSDKSTRMHSSKMRTTRLLTVRL